MPREEAWSPILAILNPDNGENRIHALKTLIVKTSKQLATAYIFDRS